MKTSISFVENVEIDGKKYKARIDTGAKLSSIDGELVKKHKLGPIVRNATIRSANGITTRKVIKQTVKIKNRKIKASFTIADRKKMEYRILIGRNILRKNFVINCE